MQSIITRVSGKNKDRQSRPLVSLVSFLMALSFGFCSSPVEAVTFGITPLPKGGENATPRDQINAMKMCVDAGVTGIFYGGTWADLEPSKGVYSLTQMGKTLKYAPKLQRFIGVQVFDITTKNMPSDLTKAKLDSPKVISRFGQLMVKMKKTTGGNIAYMSIGNEADVYLSAHPKEVDSFIKFFKAAKAEVVKTFPSCKVGITLRAENLLAGKPPSAVAQKLLDESDVVMFNYYPVTNYRPKPPQQIEKDMEVLVKVANGKQIVFQEIGYPSSPKLGSSDKNQADFITLAFKELRKNPQIEFANFFALHDLTPAICDYLAEHYLINSKNYRQAMQSLGMRKSSGKERPAWTALKTGLSEKPAVKTDETKPEEVPTDVAPGETVPAATPVSPSSPEQPETPAGQPAPVKVEPTTPESATPPAGSTDTVDKTESKTETKSDEDAAKVETKTETKSDTKSETSDTKPDGVPGASPGSEAESKADTNSDSKDKDQSK